MPTILIASAHRGLDCQADRLPALGQSGGPAVVFPAAARKRPRRLRQFAVSSGGALARHHQFSLEGKNMPDTEASLAYLLDEAAIRDVIARFADTATLADIDGFRALWADDGEWEIGAPFEQHAQGVGNIVSMCQNLWRGNDYFVQFAVPGPIQINGDEATARSMCHEAAQGPSGRYYRNNGVWHDRLRRSGNGWVFANRTYQYLWVDLSPFTGDTFMSFPQ